MVEILTFNTETWLNQKVPDAAFELAGCSIYRVDRRRTGYLHKQLVHSQGHGGHTLMPRFGAPSGKLQTIRCPERNHNNPLMAVYIPPQGKAKLALEKLHDSTKNSLCCTQTVGSL